MLLSAFVLAGGIAGGEPTEDPKFSVNPGALSFPDQCINTTSSPKAFTVKNDEPNGNESQSIDISVKQTGSSAFTRSPLQFSGHLDPDESTPFSVTFRPASRGVLLSSTFTVTAEDVDNSDNTATDSITVSGVGRDRRVAVNGSTVAFGEQRVGTRSPTKTLIVSNPGPDVLTVSAVKKVGTNAADFVVPIPAAFSLAPGATKSINVAFQPTGDGLRKATLEITSNSCTQPKLNVSLVGTGVLPNVVVQPNPIDVGTSSVGKKGKPTAVTVSNEGAAELKITTIQIIGENAADFALSGLPPVPKTLQPGESFVFAIRMTPTEEGLRLASINVLSDDPDVPTLTVSVRGSATAASPSPSASASVSVSPTASASASSTASPLPAGTPNDSLAIMLVVGGVLSAFVGLMIVRRFIRTPEDE